MMSTPIAPGRLSGGMQPHMAAATLYYNAIFPSGKKK